MGAGALRAWASTAWSTRMGGLDATKVSGWVGGWGRHLAGRHELRLESRLSLHDRPGNIRITSQVFNLVSQSDSRRR